MIYPFIRGMELSTKPLRYGNWIFLIAKLWSGDHVRKKNKQPTKLGHTAIFGKEINKGRAAAKCIAQGCLRDHRGKGGCLRGQTHELLCIKRLLSLEMGKGDRGSGKQ
jgi:hypothetical protein